MKYIAPGRTVIIYRLYSIYLCIQIGCNLVKSSVTWGRVNKLRLAIYRIGTLQSVHVPKLTMRLNAPRHHAEPQYRAGVNVLMNYTPTWGNMENDAL